MPDYQRGKIYKITSGDLTYVGSTTEKTLARRLTCHIADYKRWKNGRKQCFTSSFPLIETGDYEITLLELCPCNSRDELTARERYWVETIQCVNKNIPGRTRKEYKEDHKEEVEQWRQDYKEKHKEQSLSYYYRNQEKILAKRNEKRLEQKSLVM